MLRFVQTFVLHKHSLLMITGKYTCLLLLLVVYLYYTCDQFTSGCQVILKVYKYLQ